MIETQTSPARIVAPFPILLVVPDSDAAPSFPVRVWSALRGFVLTATDDAEYEMQLIDYELHYLAPRAVAWRDAEIAASARGELDPFPLVSFDSVNEDDWNETRNRFFELHCDRARHEATLARLGFWRRACLFGVSGAELDFARQKQMLALAGEVCKRYDIEVIPGGLTIAEMLETMDTRDLNAE
jgi:hypothetical protein